MRYAVSIPIMFAVALAMLLGPATGQEKFKKGSLPANWKKIQPPLSSVQVAKISDIRLAARAEVKKLQMQIDKVKTTEKADLYKVLTEDQRKSLTKILSGEPEPDRKPKDKDK